MADQDQRRALVDLLPQFLMRRRRGWGGLSPLLAEARLARPAFFLLRAIYEETDAGGSMSEGELRTSLYNPYATIHPVFEDLPALVGAGYLVEDHARFAVTPTGRALVERIELAARAYLATLYLLPDSDLARLAETLWNVARRMWPAPEPAAKPHQARARRLPPPEEDAAPLVQLEAAIYVLWTARDDAHMAAWRAAGFDGPSLDLFSRLWAREAETVAEVVNAVRQSQRPEDVEHGITTLIDKGYLRRDGEALHLTEHGRAIRDAIEAETDRVYFAPWPPLAPDDVAFLHETLRTACERLLS